LGSRLVPRGFHVKECAGHHRNGRRRSAGRTRKEHGRSVWGRGRHTKDETEDGDRPIFHAEHDLTNRIVK
jgi:hypothetical protein